MDGNAMSNDELKRALADLVNQQKELVEILKNKNKRKDFWDKFSAASTFISGVIVALVGLYFTNSYNAQQAARDEMLKAQQLRLAEVELVHKFIPQLNGNERDKKLAIIAISSLGNTELATKLAVLDQSRGSKAALESLAESGSAEEKTLAQRALENFKQFEPHLLDIQGGSRIGRAALEKAVQELKSGVWEQGGMNQGPHIRKYLSAAGLSEGLPWSAAFVSWCFSQVQHPPPFEPSGSWMHIKEEFRSKGWLHEDDNYVPQPGDIVIIPRETDITTYHGGIVFRLENETIEIIEGNSGDMLVAKRYQVIPNLAFGHIQD
jgi:hypothetical protein